ncbi:MAG: hypothetical protein JRF45_10390 [Deltaproteobacteria bacterium]|nr:hypothetical protein [Deltaproteobacteria bacterium]MBW1970052.1 hypothetical protein [Deltaproteobacteria bacterium]MBW2157410.1 hypothetical protein [Deltaproteobacteria bacterium]MBW2227278.1 hypothetical protein [Deltaproteobacteria bacterium]MBW2326874.1 hypothetical protein [Deltaproteobacteria bacterium]
MKKTKYTFSVRKKEIHANTLMFAGSAGIERNAKHITGTFNPICHSVLEI